jgi:hypothetical protein
VSYNDHVSDLARALARLVAAPQPPPPPADLPLVAAYRSDVVDALSGLHRRLFPAASTVAGLGLDRARDIEREPVRALGTLLAQHPRGGPADLSPSERLERTPQTWAARQWRAAAQHALLATDAASRLAPSWDADPDTAWQAAADLADITEAFAVADNDLAAAHAAYPDQAGALPSASAYTGLRVAAAECAQLARRGPLTQLDAPNTGPPTPAHPMVVRGLADLADAQHRLARMVRDSDPGIAPEMLAQVATGQARAHLSAERILHAAGEHDRAHANDYREAASALRARARNFAAIADSCGRVRSLHRGPLGPAHQTGEIMRALHRVDETLTAERGAAAAPYVLAWAARGEDVISAIDRITRQAVHAGDYLIPSDYPDRQAERPAWVPARMLTARPQLLDDTTIAAERERGISAAITGVLERTSGTAAAAKARAAAAADELRAALAGRPPARPTRPGDPMPAFEELLGGAAANWPDGTIPAAGTAERWAVIVRDLAGQSVLDDPGWPGLAAGLERAEAAGWDVTADLPRLLRQGELPDRRPARELHFRLVADCDAAAPAVVTPAGGSGGPRPTSQARQRAEMAVQQQSPNVGRDPLGR